MNRNKRLSLVLLGVALVLVLIMMFFVLRSNTGESIKIGFIGPLSGSLANFGEDIQKGVELFESQHNDLEVVYEDDGFDPQKSLSAYRKLRDIDGVDVIIGPLGPVGTFTIDGAMNAEDRKESFVFPVSLCLDDFKNLSNSLCSYPSLREQIKADLEFAKNKGKRKIYFVTERSPMGEQVEGLVNEVIASEGQELVGTTKILDFTKEMNFYSYATKIKNSGADCVFIVATFNRGVVQFVKNLKEQDVNVLVILGTDLNEDLAEEFSDVLEGVYSPAYLGDNFVSDFEKAFEEKFGEKPNMYNALGYELIAASYSVLKEKGKVDRDSLANEISNRDYALIGFRYDNDYMVHIPFTPRVVRDGKIVPVNS